ncbi:unnamed protein product [Closterium sp. NIES-54]
MDMWGPARVSGQDRERYFLLVADDYTRYTTVFPLRSKGEVPDVLIPWIRAVRLQLCERFRDDLPVLRLHSDRGGEFSSDISRDFCRGEGILQSFTLPASPQKNGVAERRIGIVMEVARTSMIHATAPYFLWPFEVRYAAHQLNLWPHVSLPETSPTLRGTEKVGDVSVFRDVTFYESVPFYRLFPYRTAPLPTPPPPSPAWRPSRGPPPPPLGPAPSGVSQVDPLLGNVRVEVAVDSGAARGAASRGAASGVAETGGVLSGGAEPASAEPGGAEPAVRSLGGAELGGAESEGAESWGADPRGAEPGGAEPGGTESEGAESRGAKPRGTASAGGPAGSSPRMSPQREPLSPQHLRKWFAQCRHLRSGAAGAGGSAAGGTGAGGTGATSLGGAGVTAGAGGTGGIGDSGAAGPGGARTRGTSAGGDGARGVGVGDPSARGAGAGGTGAGGAGAGGTKAGDSGAGDTSAGGTGAGGAGAGDPGTRGAGAGGTGVGAGGAGASGPGAGGTLQRRPFFVPPPSSLPPPDSFLRQVLSLPSSTGLTPSLRCPPPHQSQPQLQPNSPLPAPSPYAEQTDSFTELCEPESRSTSPIRTSRCVPCPRPPPIPGTHIMALRPSYVPQRVPLPPPPGSSLPAIPDPESDPLWLFFFAVYPLIFCSQFQL